MKMEEYKRLNCLITYEIFNVCHDGTHPVFVFPIRAKRTAKGTRTTERPRYPTPRPGNLDRIKRQRGLLKSLVDPSVISTRAHVKVYNGNKSGFVLKLKK